MQELCNRHKVDTRLDKKKKGAFEVLGTDKNLPIMLELADIKATPARPVCQVRGTRYIIHFNL